MIILLYLFPLVFVFLLFIFPVHVVLFLSIVGMVICIYDLIYDLITGPTYLPCLIPYQQQNPPVIPTTEEVKPFSPSEYLERIESEHIKILQEKEQRTPYTIILWLNLDGLRLNEDGSFEWIQKPIYRASFGDQSANFQWNESYIKKQKIKEELIK